MIPRNCDKIFGKKSHNHILFLYDEANSNKEIKLGFGYNKLHSPAQRIY